jgi:hypothetical protein
MAAACGTPMLVGELELGPGVGGGGWWLHEPAGGHVVGPRISAEPPSTPLDPREKHRLYSQPRSPSLPALQAPRGYRALRWGGARGRGGGLPTDPGLMLSSDHPGPLYLKAWPGRGTASRGVG